MKKHDRFVLLSDESIWILEKREKKKKGNRLKLCCLTGPHQGSQRLINIQTFRDEYKKAELKEIEKAFQAHKPPSRVLGADGNPFRADKKLIVQSR